MYNAVTVGDKLRNRRISFHLSQDRMAERLDLSQRYYSQLERGEAGMSMNTFIKVCEVMRMTPNELLGFSLVDEHNPLQAQLLAQLWRLTDAQCRALMDLIQAFHVGGEDNPAP